MLNNETTKKVENFVLEKPRSISEIASMLNRNWRTADRYVDEIEKEFGTISTRVFREGTRGALKIVYPVSREKISSSAYQEKLEQEIFRAKRKEEFSAFDIYQFANEKKKSISTELQESENLEEYSKIISNAKKQILIYSGNLSFINLKYKKTDIFAVFEELVKKGVSIKVISRVDFDGKENIEKILSLNMKYGKDLVEVKHDDHPIRGIIVDKEIVRLKEVKEPTGKIKELNKRLFIFYNIREKEWIEWLTKLFWKKFSQSVDAKLRLNELNKISLKKDL